MKLTTYLKNNKNFDIKYEVHNPDGELIFDGKVTNEEINDENIGKGRKAILSRDITKDNLVYGNDYYTLTVTAITTDKGKELKSTKSISSVNETESSITILFL